ncbi:MAG: cytochrome c oxidase subunit 3 [Burkholderiales bacterium]|nr:cytochrome c oxidase subunit 3 [Burkholderiales bacterium]OJV51064.1 MAG: cytochrome c oxidase subunit 3 [Burkholderiales bacterium 68-10]OJX00945.1 MAG: cytochrome c oxidase subunit 3 [Burkholderiales bacterium 70-64]
MATDATSRAPYYFTPQPSKWPVVGAIAMAFFGLGLASWFNDASFGPWLFAIFVAILVYMLVGWFGTVARESEGGLYNARVDSSFRWSMSWFIFSEVMFFGAFFGALYYARTVSMPWLADIDSKALLWPDFQAVWPNAGPAGTIEPFQTMGPWPIPTINTALLLTSGITVTIAHHALKENRRGALTFWLAATVLLGLAFLGFQAYEYAHAYQELNLKLSSGIFGSTFFMLTGFHGFHVTVGAIALSAVLYRVVKGHFTPERHFAFEGAAWYWHFVDVVWLGLYVVVYWL